MPAPEAHGPRCAGRLRLRVRLRLRRRGACAVMLLAAATSVSWQTADDPARHAPAPVQHLPVAPEPVAAAPVHPAPADPVPVHRVPDERVPDQASAAALFTELGRRLSQQPCYVVAGLDVTRDGVTRHLVLRLHLRAPGHLLLQVKEAPGAGRSVGAGLRDDGNVLLLHEGELHAWFPRAGLALNVPGMLAGTRLCGSDFALDQLLAVAGDASRWRAVDVLADSLGDESCQRLVLHPRPAGADSADAPDTAFAVLELLLARGPDGALLPRQIDGFDAQGVLVSRVRLQSSGRLELPDTWTAWTLPLQPGAASGADVSTLRLMLLESNPPVAAELFLPQALRSWL